MSHYSLHVVVNGFEFKEGAGFSKEAKYNSPKIALNNLPTVTENCTKG